MVDRMRGHNVEQRHGSRPVLPRRLRFQAGQAFHLAHKPTPRGVSVVGVDYLLLKNIEISGLQISDYCKRRPTQIAACFAEIFSLYEQGKIRLAPATTFPLVRAGEVLPHSGTAGSPDALCYNRTTPEQIGEWRCDAHAIERYGQ